MSCILVRDGKKRMMRMMIMPDITMCANSNCLQKERCYRFSEKQGTAVQGGVKFLPDAMGYCGFYRPMPTVSISNGR